MSTITIYRINERQLSEPNPLKTLFTDRARMKELTLQPGLPARLFYGKGPMKEPEWAAYLAPIVTDDIPTTRRATESAVLIVDTAADDGHLYAITWGSGHLLLRPDIVHPDLGLRCALNLLAETEAGKEWDPDKLRAVRTKRFSKSTMITQMQASRKGNFDDFPVNFRADQLRQVTAAPTDSDPWGKSITGGTSLHIRRPADPALIVDLCRKVDTAYQSQKYKTRYGWVDNVAPIADVELVHRAIEELLMRVSIGDRSVECSPPTLLNWEDIAAFEIRLGRKRVEFDDPSADALASAMTTLSSAQDFISDGLNMSMAAVDHDGNDRYVWPLWKCLNAELEIDTTFYVFDEGALYAVDNKFLYDLNAFVKGIPSPNHSFVAAAPRERESHYLERLAAHWRSSILLDRQLVRRPQATDIEVCDIALPTRVLIHAKRGKESASLSHLFAQGAVSAELLHMDPEFRAAAEERIADVAGRRRGRFEWIWASPFEPTTCEVCFLLILGSKGPTQKQDLPFFSKINLRQRCEDLRRMGFRYSLGFAYLS